MTTLGRKRAVALSLSAALALLVVGATVAFAAGRARLDPSFGTDGIVRTAVAAEAGGATGLEQGGARVAHDARGRLVVVTGVGDRMVVGRYLPSGRLDPSFGEAGLASIFWADAQASAVAIQSDGKILVGGATGLEHPSGVLARLDPDGDLDETFRGPNSPPGKASVGRGEDVLTIAMQGQRILVGGENGYIARLRPDGSRDTSFAGGHGYRVLVPPIPAGAKRVVRDAGVTSILASKGGEIFAAGYFNGSFFLARLTAAGRLDGSFADGGIVRTNAAARKGCACSVGQGLARDAKGRLLVSGFVTSSSRPAFRPNVAVKPVAVALARYLPSGQLDRSFGQGGITRTTIKGYEPFGRGVAIQRNGLPVVAGTLSSGPNKSSRLAVIRYRADGRPDRTFFNHGVFSAPTGAAGERAAGWDPLIDSSGRIVVAGTNVALGAGGAQTPELLFARILPNPAR
jgi:uncharacterized delta-60 repeat protein